MDNARDMLFHSYFSEWVDTYKRGCVRPVTLDKYLMTLKRLAALAPTLTMGELNKRGYQSLLNTYAENHEKATTGDFHTHLKAAIYTAIDEGVIEINPCRNAVIKGCDSGKNKKVKALSVREYEQLINALDIFGKSKWDYFIYLIAKTGMRFAEALAITPRDFDYENKTLSITKSFNYKKTGGGFIPTKTSASRRTIDLDDKTLVVFKSFLRDAPREEPVFVQLGKRIFNANINNYLFRICDKAHITKISIHGLRHTHATVLFCQGVSVLSVSKRLGHANVNVTQNTYLHIIRDLEDKDTKKITSFLSSI